MNNLVSNYIGFDGRLNRQRWWISAIILAVVLIVIMVAACWRTIIRLVLAVLAAVVLVAVGYGVIVIIGAIHA